MNDFERLHNKFTEMYKGKLSEEDKNLLIFSTVAIKHHDISTEMLEFIEKKLDTAKPEEEQIQDIVLYMETLIPPVEIEE